MINKPILPFLILLFSCVFVVQTLAQPATPDSLRQALDAYPLPAKFQAKDTAYFSLAEALCGQYMSLSELDSLVAVSGHALNLLEKFKGSVTGLESRIDVFKMQFFRFKGIAIIQLGDYPEALTVFQQYAVVAEKTGSVKDMGTSNTYIGYCHRAMEDYELAFQYAQKSIAILKNTPYRAALANNYTTYATYYGASLHNSDSAIYYSKLARQIYHDEKKLMNEAITTFDIAAGFALGFQADSALFYINLAKPLLEIINTKELRALYHIRLGEVLFIKGMKKESLHHLEIGSKLATELGNPRYTYGANKFLTLALALNGQTVESIKWMEATTGGFAENINTAKIRELNKAQLNFEFEKKEARAKVELERQKRIRDISLLGLFLGLIVALLLFRLYSQSKKTAQVLKEKNNQIEKSYRELQETQEQLVLTEKQREAQSIRVRIARDIHDELGAGLTKITMMSDLVRKKLPPGNEAEAQMLKRIVENSKAVSASLSEIVWAVNPAHDTLDSLANYLKNYAGHFLDDSGMQGEYDFQVDKPAQTIEPELKRNIFLVMKEALNNAAKYAGANTIWLSFIVKDNNFALTIRDNGTGFNLNEITENGGSGNGLLNMKSRMETLHRHFEIITTPGQGCTIKASGKLYHE